MKKSTEFVQNDIAKELVVKRATKAFCFHIQFNLCEAFV